MKTQSKTILLGLLLSGLVVGGVFLSLHYLFVLGLGLFTVALWARNNKGYSVGTRGLFLIAVVVWLLGVGNVAKAFRLRPDSWYAAVRWRFTGWNSRQAANDHHKILDPVAKAERFPAIFDTLHTAADVSVEFTLENAGTVSAAKVVRSSGNVQVDQAAVAQVSNWKFGALPADFQVKKPQFLPFLPDTLLPPKPEIITVRFYNNYILNQLSLLILGFLVLYPLLWGLGVRSLKDSRLGRLLIVVGLVGGLSWVLIYRLGPEQGNLDLVSKQSAFLLVAQLLLLGLPRVLPVLRRLQRRFSRGANASEEIAGWLPRGWGLVLLSAFLLLLTRFFGTSGGTEATLWIPLGPLGRFQTIELVKLLMVGFVAQAAYGMTRTFQKVRQGPGATSRSVWDQVSWVVYAFLIVLSCLVIMKDMGPGLLLLIFLAFFFSLMGQTWLSRIALLGLVVLGLSSYLTGSVTSRYLNNSSTKVFTHTYERTRIWLDTWQVQPGERADGHEQMAQAQWMLSSGGFWGRGLGNGHPEKVAAVESDFVFAALAEEIGWLGCTSLLLCLLYISATLIEKTRESQVLYEQVLVGGIGLLLGIQAFLILAGNLRLMPLTGITLPFVSYGGSSMVMNFLAIALAIATLTNPLKLQTPEEPTAFKEKLRNLPLLFLVGTTALFVLVLGIRQLPFPWGSQDKAELMIVAKEPGQVAEIKKNPRFVEPGAVSIPSGQVRTADGTLLVEVTRARGALLHLTPSLSFVQTDLLARLNEVLHGESQSKVELRGDAHERGFDVVLTIDSRLQKLAEQILANSRFNGSLVGIDPQTGKILFAASRSGEETKSEKAWYTTGYFPGSTFKTVIMAAGLSTGKWTAQTALNCPSEYLGSGEFGGGGIPKRLTATKALIVSRNTWFMKATNELLGGEALEQFCNEHAGFGRRFSLLPESFRAEGQSTWLVSEPSVLSQDSARLNQQGLFLALTGTGQQDVHMTPLHLAAWVGALANGGTFLEPTVLDRIEDNRGRTLWKSAPNRLGSPLPAATIAALKPMMRGVVKLKGGTAAAAFQGCRIAVWGKTGTAQWKRPGRRREERNDGLFIGYTPHLAVAVVQEDIGADGVKGGEIAAPLARKMIEAQAAH